MSTELALLLFMFAVIFGGVFSKNNPLDTFDQSAPRLAARVERAISVGEGFTQKSASGRGPDWIAPGGGPPQVP